VGKNGVLEHKSGNIPETRKDRGKVTVEGLQELTNALSNGTIPTSYGLLFPKIGGSEPPSKTLIAIISRTSKATDFKFGRYIHRVHPNKSPFKISEKRERGRIQGFVGGTPISSGTGKATNFKFCTHIHRIDRRTKAR